MGGAKAAIPPSPRSTHPSGERIGDPRPTILGLLRQGRKLVARTLHGPERSWEGVDAPLTPSVRSTAYGQVNQLRDPAIFEEDGRTYLLYAVAGESGIAIAEIWPDEGRRA